MKKLIFGLLAFCLVTVVAVSAYSSTQAGPEKYMVGHLNGNDMEISIEVSATAACHHLTNHPGDVALSFDACDMCGVCP